MVSIITTFFNAEDYLESCIGSVRSIPDQDMIEHLLVDDGSTDSSKNIAIKHKSKNTILLSEGRIGRANALNLAIKRSRYKYICILDSDDMINPEWISFFIKNVVDFEDNDKSAVFFGKTCFIGDQQLCQLNYVSKPSSYNFLNFNSTRIFFHNPVPHLGTIFNKDFFQGNNPYDNSRSTQLDWDLWFRFISMKKNFLKFDIFSGSKRIHANQFFEQQRHFKYTVMGVLLQLSWTLKLKKYLLPIVFIIALLRLVWCLIPKKFRISFYRQHE